jgi:nucleoside-diphosphate-sugar epimerase
MMSLEGLSVLVTGASGFLGNVIIDELNKSGIKTVAVSWPPMASPSSGSIMVDLDLEQTDLYTKLDVYGPFYAIIHCAALLPGACHDRDLLISNQMMTYNLLEWGIRKGIRHFLFASSCRVYGLHDHPCDESSPLAPPDFYAVSKVACEGIIKTMTSISGILYSILRISAPYGHRSNQGNVIRRFLMDGARDQPLVLRGSGNRSQDFIYESDVATAFRQALVHEANGVFNIAGGRSISTLELAETVLHLFGRDMETSMVFSGVDDQENYRGNFPIEAASRAFGFHPQISLADGIKHTAQAWGLL